MVLLTPVGMAVAVQFGDVGGDDSYGCWWYFGSVGSSCKSCGSYGNDSDRHGDGGGSDFSDGGGCSYDGCGCNYGEDDGDGVCDGYDDGYGNYGSGCGCGEDDGSSGFGGDYGDNRGGRYGDIGNGGNVWVLVWILVQVAAIT